MILWLDLETYSDIDIKNGAYRYAEGAEVILFSYAIDDAPARVVDVAHGEKYPQAVVDAFNNPDCILIAHNAQFDRTVLKKFIPAVAPPRRWKDSMIKAYSLSLPGSLAALCEYCGLPVDKAKDKEGGMLVRKFCIPQRVRCMFPGDNLRYLPPANDADWQKFINYARLDVEAMREVWKRLPGWNDTPAFWAEWHIDQDINDRGMQIDIELARCAIEASAEASEKSNATVRKVTKGAVNTAGQRNALMDFMAALGYSTDDLRKTTLEHALEDPALPDEARELILARLQAAKASVKKYDALIRSTCADGRLRGCLLFCGAQKTGRWCLTGDHEVLTPDGWARLDEWEGGEIACWNPQSEAISFKHAGRVAFEYSGKMFESTSKRCTQVCTPDHRMPYLNKKGFWDCDIMENLAPRRFEMPYTGFRAVSANTDSAELRVLIMTQADGHYTQDGAVRYHFKKARKIERCKMLLRRAGIVFCVRDNADNSTLIEIKARHVPLWLRMFENKTFGGWLLNESPDVVFDELLHWDSYQCGPHSIQYSSTNKRNVDLIQALAHLSGRAATLLDRKARKENWNTCYMLNIWLSPGGRHQMRREYTREIEFSGRVYCATTETGFFMVRRCGVVWITGNSGRLFQPQNLPRGTLTPAQVDIAIDAIKHGAASVLYDDVNSVVSSCLRGSIIAPPGKKLVVADLSNIEGRVLAWLAGEHWKLDAFRAYDRGEGVDLYKATYARTFGVKPEDVTKKQRQIGKVLELAMGYMGGVGSFMAFATAYGVDLKDLAEHTYQALDKAVLFAAHDQWDFFVRHDMTNGLDEWTWTALNAIKNAWRDAHPAIRNFWNETELRAGAAFEAQRYTGAGYYPCAFANTKFGLACRLPSGRVMAYPRAEPAAEGERCLFKYYAPLKVRKGFAMSKTHAGKIVENITQATARDVLAANLASVEAAGYKIILSVHDELITETPDTPEYNAETLAGLMATPPEWAKDLPLAAAGFEAYRYKKD